MNEYQHLPVGVTSLKPKGWWIDKSAPEPFGTQTGRSWYIYIYICFFCWSYVPVIEVAYSGSYWVILCHLLGLPTTTSYIEDAAEVVYPGIPPADRVPVSTQEITSLSIHYI